jgi:hypothetical protein
VAVGGLGQPGLLEVGRDEGVAVAAPGGHPGHPLVQAAPSRQRDVVVEHVADEGVAEVEAAVGVGARHHQVPLLELPQPVVDGFVGVTEEQLLDAHRRDQAIEGDEGVHFDTAWLDHESGKVFCLSTGPSKESVLRIHERAGHPTTEIYEVPVEVV